MSALSPFHPAIPVDDLSVARRFHDPGLPGPEEWLDHANQVDGHQVPVPRFGMVLPWEEWESVGRHLGSVGGVFVVPPHVRFTGQPGEQGTFFFRDSSGNALEFKAFKDLGRLLATA